MRHIGVTGSRHGTSREQYDIMRTRLEALLHEAGRGTAGGGVTLHHGGATGADAECHVAAWVMGYRAVVHPPSNPRWRAWVERGDFWDRDTDILLPQKDYMARNLDIVQAVSLLLVIPRGSEEDEPRSGTWATYRMALRLGVPTVLIGGPAATKATTLARERKESRNE